MPTSQLHKASYQNVNSILVGLISLDVKRPLCLFKTTTPHINAIYAKKKRVTSAQKADFLWLFCNVVSILLTIYMKYRLAMENMLAQRLRIFGVNKKQTELYLLLLNGGAKTLSELVSLMNASRSDILDTLSGLSELGMIEESVERPTRYYPAPIEAALNSAIMKHARDLRRMERSKLEIIELVNSEAKVSEGRTYPIFK